MISPFKKRLNADITSRLREIGFVKKGFLYIYSQDQDSVLSLFITSRRSYEKNVVILSVSVGVAMRSVNRIFIQLNHLPKSNYVSEDMFIVGRNLGYLMPQKSYKEWFFDESTYSGIALNEMIDAIQGNAFPYYEGRNNLETLGHYVYETNEMHTKIGRDEYYPIILYLSNRKDEAIRYVTRIVDSKTHDGLEGENYLSFAKEFFQLQ